MHERTAPPMVHTSVILKRLKHFLWSCQAFLSLSIISHANRSQILLLSGHCTCTTLQLGYALVLSLHSFSVTHWVPDYIRSQPPQSRKALVSALPTSTYICRQAGRVADVMTPWGSLRLTPISSTHTFTQTACTLYMYVMPNTFHYTYQCLE